MRNEFGTRLRRGLLASACGVFVALSGAMSAQAQTTVEDDDDTFEQRIIKNILGGLGVDVGRAGIEYRERSPLVIPPSLDLPPPETADVAARNPSWPREQELKKKSAAVQNRSHSRATPEEPGTSSLMTPDELRRGINPRAQRITDPSKSNSTEENQEGRPLRPGELGSSSIFNWRALTGTYTPEQAQFTGEPTRGSLTQPPPGYQTPSSSQAYGVGQERGSGWKIPTILDRPVGQEGR